TPVFLPGPGESYTVRVPTEDTETLADFATREGIDIPEQGSLEYAQLVRRWDADKQNRRARGPAEEFVEQKAPEDPEEWRSWIEDQLEGTGFIVSRYAASREDLYTLEYRYEPPKTEPPASTGPVLTASVRVLNDSLRNFMEALP